MPAPCARWRSSSVPTIGTCAPIAPRARPSAPFASIALSSVEGAEMGRGFDGLDGSARISVKNIRVNPSNPFDPWSILQCLRDYALANKIVRRQDCDLAEANDTNLFDRPDIELVAAHA